MKQNTIVVVGIFIIAIIIAIISIISIIPETNKILVDFTKKLSTIITFEPNTAESSSSTTLQPTTTPMIISLILPSMYTKKTTDPIFRQFTDNINNYYIENFKLCIVSANIINNGKTFEIKTGNEYYLLADVTPEGITGIPDYKILQNVKNLIIDDVSFNDVNFNSYYFNGIGIFDLYKKVKNSYIEFNSIQFVFDSNTITDKNIAFVKTIPFDNLLAINLNIQIQDYNNPNKIVVNNTITSIFPSLRIKFGQSILKDFILVKSLVINEKIKIDLINQDSIMVKNDTTRSDNLFKITKIEITDMITPKTSTPMTLPFIISTFYSRTYDNDPIYRQITSYIKYENYYLGKFKLCIFSADIIENGTTLVIKTGDLYYTTAEISNAGLILAIPNDKVNILASVTKIIIDDVPFDDIGFNSTNNYFTKLTSAYLYQKIPNSYTEFNRIIINLDTVNIENNIAYVTTKKYLNTDKYLLNLQLRAPDNVHRICNTSTLTAGDSGKHWQDITNIVPIVPEKTTTKTTCSRGYSVYIYPSLRIKNGNTFLNNNKNFNTIIIDNKIKINGVIDIDSYKLVDGFGTVNFTDVMFKFINVESI